MRKKIIAIISGLSILLSGCISLPESSERNIEISKIYSIENNIADSHEIQISENVEEYLDEQGLTNNDLRDGYRWVVCKGVENIWKCNICTQEDETFVYRNMQYYIPVYEGKDYILYQLPGNCCDYMIFEYSKGGVEF